MAARLARFEASALAAFLAFAERLEEDTEKLQQRMAPLTGDYRRGQ